MTTFRNVADTGPPIATAPPCGWRPFVIRRPEIEAPITETLWIRKGLRLPATDGARRTVSWLGPGPSMSIGVAIVGRSDPRSIVPIAVMSIWSPPPRAFASWIAARRVHVPAGRLVSHDPSPAAASPKSPRSLTVKFAALAGPARTRPQAIAARPARVARLPMPALLHPIPTAPSSIRASGGPEYRGFRARLPGFRRREREPCLAGLVGGSEP